MGSPAAVAPPDEARFRLLYDACYADVLRFVQRRADPSHAEDVTAEVFLVAWRRVAELPQEPGAARGWLFGVARRTLLNDQRGRGRRTALAVRIAAAPAADAGDDHALVERCVDLATAWPRLSATDQEALALTVWDGLAPTEAAAVLGITSVAFRLRLSRARRALRRHLDPPDDAGPAEPSSRLTSTRRSER